MCHAVYLCAGIYVSAPAYTAHVSIRLKHINPCVYLNVRSIISLSSANLVTCCYGLSVGTQTEHTQLHLQRLCNCSCLYAPYVLCSAICVVHTGYSHQARLPDGHPSSSLMSWGFLEPLAVASGCIVLLVYISSCLHASSNHVAVSVPMAPSPLCSSGSLSPNGC